MTHNYTPNMLVKYIYGETDLFETLEIENAIEEDTTLMNEYQTLKSAQKQLPKLSFAPSASSLQNILFFSEISQMDALQQ